MDKVHSFVGTGPMRRKLELPLARTVRGACIALLLGVFAACGPGTPALDSGTGPDSAVPDAGQPDAGASDAGLADAGLADAGLADAGVADAGVADAGVADAGVADAGIADAGVADAGVADAGIADAGVADAGVADAGEVDSGAPDASLADAGVADAGTPDAGAFDAGPCLNCAPAPNMTFKLPSPAGITAWTTTTMDKVFVDSPVPSANGPSITLSAAKNEFEPFQLVVHSDTATHVSLSMTSFTGPGVLGDIEIRRVGYVLPQYVDDGTIRPDAGIKYPDALNLTAFGTSESLTVQQNQPFWITVHVPKTAVAGDYVATLSLTVGASTQMVPVTLHVYTFAIPDSIACEGSWDRELGSGAQGLASALAYDNFWFAHRLPPDNAAWPAALVVDTQFDCASHSWVLNPSDPYDFAVLGPEFVFGTGWNDAGFPSFPAVGVPTRGIVRPDLCGVMATSPTATSPFNTAWASLLSGLNSLLVSHQWQTRAYYLATPLQNVTQTDFDNAAALTKLTRTAAPDLRCGVGSSPRREIAENPLIGGTHVTVWWSEPMREEAAYARQRQALGEQIWWVPIDEDRPFAHPFNMSHAGLESRIIFWSAFSSRVRGLAQVGAFRKGQYTNPLTYGLSAPGAGPVPSIRTELLREGEEDYEYLLLAAGGALTSTPGQPVACDLTSKSAARNLLEYTHDPAALMFLRNQLGSFLEGNFPGCPLLPEPALMNPRQATYLNFQDPNGPPTANPLVANGHTWAKVGWASGQGYGWNGPHVDDPVTAKYAGPAPSADPIQFSGVWDDSKNVNVFNWNIEDGSYTVTVGIGSFQPAFTQTFPNNRVVVEGEVLFNNVTLDFNTPTMTKSVDIMVVDHNVTLEVGAKGDWTFLSWVSIVPR